LRRAVFPSLHDRRGPFYWFHGQILPHPDKAFNCFFEKNSSNFYGALTPGFLPGAYIYAERGYAANK
jgi:hypothetical protein